MTIDQTTMTDSLLSHISNRAKDRVLVSFGGAPLPDTLKKHPKPISLAGGRPHAEFFPIHKLQLEIIDEPFSGKKHGYNEVSKFNQDTLDLSTALQYGPTEGHDHVIQFAKDLVSKVSKPGYDDWDLIFTNGTGDSLHKVFNLLINPGDVVLVESYTYVPVVANIVNYGGIVVSAELDFAKKGIDVNWLSDLLDNWSSSKYSHLSKPKALYTIPTGQNPTGLSITNEERARIYKLAQKHDFIIIEDDPYGYIQLGDYTDGITNQFQNTESYPLEKYIEQDLPNSYIKYDTEGRVLRLESFSKVFAPGTRLGFIVGLKHFIDHISRHTLVSTRASSGVSQVVLNAVLEHVGGVEGWLKWNIKISKEYTKRKNILLKALFESDSFKSGQFEVIEPEAGMFTIVNINFPENEEDDYREPLEQLRYKTLENGVTVVLGKNMAFEEEYAKKAKFLRLTIATQDSEDEIIEGAKRLTNAISEYFH